MPGLIDAHIHTGLSILRGTAQDMSNWMHKGIWPFMKNTTEEETLKGASMIYCAGSIGIIDGLVDQLWNF
jgi:5-methylthioadenosine/S-adenosylhomocysteine deaminase